MPLKMLPLAKDDPPTTVDPCEPFRLQVSNDPLGLIDVPVFIDARSRTWMLDPTAPFNLIARSTAHEVGLTVSQESATIHTLTGRPIQVHVTVIPRFTIGGRLTLHNVTAFVFDDADYYFPRSGYQVEGVLGYPALAAMGSLTVSDNTIQVRPAREIERQRPGDLLTNGARFYLDGDRDHRRSRPHARSHRRSCFSGCLRCQLQHRPDDDRMFAIDAGGQQTYLTSRYFDEHAAEFNSQKMEMFSFPGNGIRAAARLYRRDCSSRRGRNQDRPALHPRSHAAARLRRARRCLWRHRHRRLDQLKSYTFDYRTMRFSARQE